VHCHNSFMCHVNVISLPYIKGTVDKTTKIMRNRDIKITFTPLKSIRKRVGSLKDMIKPNSCKAVYSISCSCGNVYLKETWRSMEVRFKEHNANLRHNNSKKSTLAEHSHLTKRQICKEKATIIAKEKNINRRKIR